MSAPRAELLVGRVLHARRPAAGSGAATLRNAFLYPLFFVRVPLSRWGEGSGFWLGFDRWRPLAINRRDHACGSEPPQAWVRGVLASLGLHAADGEVLLQTFPRVFGMLFNPVSFWWIHGVDGHLRAVIAEVNNTFGERHLYVLAHADQRPIRPDDWLTARKVFHVSPFFPVNGEYRFRFAATAAGCRVDIDYYLDGERALVTRVEGTPAPLDNASARGAALRFPLLALGVIGRIHWQALRLWGRRATFFSKPNPPVEEITR